MQFPALLNYALYCQSIPRCITLINAFVPLPFVPLCSCPSLNVLFAMAFSLHSSSSSKHASRDGATSADLNPMASHTTLSIADIQKHSDMMKHAVQGMTVSASASASASAAAAPVHNIPAISACASAPTTSPGRVMTVSQLAAATAAPKTAEAPSVVSASATAPPAAPATDAAPSVSVPAQAKAAAPTAPVAPAPVQVEQAQAATAPTAQPLADVNTGNGSVGPSAGGNGSVGPSAGGNGSVGPSASGNVDDDGDVDMNTDNAQAETTPAAPEAAASSNAEAKQVEAAPVASQSRTKRRRGNDNAAVDSSGMAELMRTAQEARKHIAALQQENQRLKAENQTLKETPTIVQASATTTQLVSDIAKTFAQRMGASEESSIVPNVDKLSKMISPDANLQLCAVLREANESMLSRRPPAGSAVVAASAAAPLPAGVTFSQDEQARQLAQSMRATFNGISSGVPAASTARASPFRTSNVAAAAPQPTVVAASAANKSDDALAGLTDAQKEVALRLKAQDPDMYKMALEGNVLAWHM